MNQNTVTWNLCTCYPHPHHPFFNLLSPWPYCLSNSTDYWWYWLSSIDCLKLFPQTHKWGYSVGTTEHKGVKEKTQSLWKLTECIQDNRSSGVTALTAAPWLPLLQPCRAAELYGLTSTTSLSYGSRIFYHFTHLSHFTGYFAPTQTAVLMSMPNNMFQSCWSDQPNTLTQEIPPTKTCSDPCLSPHLAQPTCSTHSLHPLPNSKTQPTNAKTPVLTQLSTVIDMTSAWQTGYTNTLFVPLPDVLLLVKLTSRIPLTLGLLTADNMDSREVSAWSFFTQEPDTVHHW